MLYSTFKYIISCSYTVRFCEYIYSVIQSCNCERVLITMIKYALFVVKSIFVSNISLFTGKHLPCVKAWIQVMFSASVSVPIQLN